MTRDYYGTKRVTSWPQTKQFEGKGERGLEEPANVELRSGYAVKYADGYISWRPKDVFEAAYQPLDALSFGHAIAAMKAGQRVARAGWNGKNMFLILIPGSVFTVAEGRPLAKAFPIGTVIEYLPHIDMKTVDGKVVPWLASQTDMLADDWMIIDELPACAGCGGYMVRSKEGDGICYVCLNCGEKSGKS
jgi:hypothetical protein